MKKLFLLVVAALFLCSTASAQNVRRIATWNMKWLGGVTGSRVDPAENAVLYAQEINNTTATLFAIQEITPSHSEGGNARCYFLDLIVEQLNTSAPSDWVYLIDDRNSSQRLGYLYRTNQWTLTDARTISPGSSYNHVRRPYIVRVQAIGNNASLQFDIINVHMKAFPDEEVRRTLQFDELTTWLQNNTLDEDVLICGDSNIFFGQADTDDELTDSGYVYLFDAARTALHNGGLSQRFDRFYCSADLEHEVDSAVGLVGGADKVMVHRPPSSKFDHYDENVSDHFPVTLAVDVSVERTN